MTIKMKMINENENENKNENDNDNDNVNDTKQYSNWSYQDSFYFFYERYFKCKKYKQKHLSNIQPNISKQNNI